MKVQSVYKIKIYDLEDAYVALDKLLDKIGCKEYDREGDVNNEWFSYDCGNYNITVIAWGQGKNVDHITIQVIEGEE